MNAITYNAWNPRHLGYVIVFTALINGSLFAALPWLTHIVDIAPPNEDVSPYIFFPKSQPKPPERARDERIIDREFKPLPKPTISDPFKQNLKRDFDFLVGKDGLGNSVQVATLEPELVDIVPKGIIFNLNQLDKEPRIIRKVLPMYPFAAKSQGISARVKVRCLVDKNGIPQKIVAAECDPEDALDIFGPPAVKAVQKWRFSPGEIGGDPVLTKVAFNLFFEMD